MSVLFCRLCAEGRSTADLLDLSSDSQLREEIAKNLSLFAENAVDFTDKTLPEVVCTGCRNTLHVCCIFLIKIRHSQDILLDYKSKGLLRESAAISEENWKLARIKSETPSDSETYENVGVSSQNDYNFDVPVEKTIVLVKQESIVKDEIVEDPLKNEESSVTENIRIITSHEPKTFDCTCCGDSFPTWKQLVAHTSTDNDHVPVKKKRTKITAEELTCNVCHKISQSRADFNEHKLIHSNRTRDFKCEECGKSYFTLSALKGHKVTHKSDPQVCTTCHKVFQNMFRLRKHEVRMHSIVTKFECDICHHIFNTKYKIARHMIVHSDRFPYLCKFCGKGFKYPAGLKNHENVHNKAKPYTCTECGRKFTMWSNCNKHMKRIHGCSLVKSSKTEPSNVHQNLQMESSEDKKMKMEKKADVLCGGCGKKFLTKTALTAHRRIAHKDYESQVCTICNATLANWRSLEKHMKKHRGDTFECDHCHQKFKTKSLIRSHMIVHIDVKPFHCDHCGKRFKRARHLKLHLRTHGIGV